MSIIKKITNLNIYSTISPSASLIFAWYSAERAKTGSSFSYLLLLSLSGSTNPGGAAHATPPGGIGWNRDQMHSPGSCPPDRDDRGYFHQYQDQMSCFFMHGLPDYLSESYISIFDLKAEHSPTIFFPVLRFTPKRLAPAWYI